MRRSPTSALVCLAFLVSASIAPAQPYNWTISASSTDPFANTAAFAPGVAQYFLWLESCDLPDPLRDGMTAAEFGLVMSDPANFILAATAKNGFLNAGPPPSPGGIDLLLARGGCPCGPVVAIELLVLVTVPATICFAPSELGGKIWTVDCEALPSGWPMSWTGLGIGVPAPGQGDSCEPDLSGACCFEDGSCMQADRESDCVALGGTFLGAGTDCSGGCPSFAGACCFNDGTCIEADGPMDCASLGGAFQGAGTDCFVGCPVLTGACCFENGSCVITESQAECATLGGVFQGKGTDCSGGCPSFAGACCFNDGTCIEADGPMGCASLGGNFLGSGTDCSVTCPVLTGACCFEDGPCVVTDSRSECEALGGLFQGNGTDCSVSCSFAGACCLSDSVCVETDSPSDCAALGGTFLGIDTDCSGGCPSTAGACCFGDDTCIATASEPACAGLGGTFLGVGTHCPSQPSQREGYTWTVSGSPTSPFENSVPFVPGVSTAHLWLACSHLPGKLRQGMAAAEFRVFSTSPANLILSVTAVNGFLNAGPPPSPNGIDLLLAVGGCPAGPILAARVLVLRQVPDQLCIGDRLCRPSLEVTADCEAPPKAKLWAFSWIGLDSGGSDPCTNGTICPELPTSLRRSSWGSIKALYR